MIKIPSLFKRDYDRTYLVYDEYVEGSEEIARDGTPTVKWDGTAARFQDGKLFRRYDNKKGKKPPRFFEPCISEPDPKTGHWPGWIPISEDNPADKWFFEAWRMRGDFPDGTYELCGPKFQSNPHKFDEPVFVAHGCDVIHDLDGHTFNTVKSYLDANLIEGIVWHHPDGRMCKIKRRDFGFKWPEK